MYKVAFLIQVVLVIECGIRGRQWAASGGAGAALRAAPALAPDAARQATSLIPHPTSCTFVTWFETWFANAANKWSGTWFEFFLEKYGLGT